MCVSGNLPARSVGQAVACAAPAGAARWQKKNDVRQRVVGEEQLALQGESMMDTRAARERQTFLRVPRRHCIAGLVA